MIKWRFSQSLLAYSPEQSKGRSHSIAVQAKGSKYRRSFPGGGVWVVREENSSSIRSVTQKDLGMHHMTEAGPNR